MAVVDSNLFAPKLRCWEVYDRENEVELSTAFDYMIDLLVERNVDPYEAVGDGTIRCSGVRRACAQCGPRWRLYCGRVVSQSRGAAIDSVAPCRSVISANGLSYRPIVADEECCRLFCRFALRLDPRGGLLYG